VKMIISLECRDRRKRPRNGGRHGSGDAGAERHDEAATTAALAAGETARNDEQLSRAPVAMTTAPTDNLS